MTTLVQPKIVKSPYWRKQPTIKQWVALHFTSKPDRPQAILYGGAAGGGKSEFLVFAATQWMHDPQSATLVLRRTLPELRGEDGLIPRFLSTYPDWKWSAIERRLEAPTGASVTFGYMDDSQAHLRYQGLAFTQIHIDESTNFPEYQIRYMFSRLRRREGATVPLRMIFCSNPGGVSHQWHKSVFVDGDDPDYVFIPSKLEDNPHLDQDAYRRQLEQLDPVTRMQLLHGDWDARIETGFLDVNAIDEREICAFEPTRSVRSWDLAGTKATGNSDPDYTVGMRIDYAAGRYWISDVVRIREAPAEVEARVMATAQIDGSGVEILMEQEPGSSGKTVISDYSRKLAGYIFKGIPSTGDKTERARPLAAAIANGNVSMRRAPWNVDLLDEWAAFPTVGVHDDTVDAASQAVNELAQPASELVWF